MWIVTDQGFFSFVVDRKDPDYLWLRARVREDLERNFPGVEVIAKPGSDYLFRAKVLRTDVAARMSEMIMSADIQGHFKDVAIKRSAKPTHGNRSTAYYAFWNAMAALQPYRPYSKVPREQEKVWTPPKGAKGQTGLPMFSNPGSGRYDWSSNPWSSDYVGRPQADPPLGGTPVSTDPEGIFRDPTQRLLDAATEEEFEDIWAAMSDHEREDYLDEVEESQRIREEMEEEHGAAAAAEASGNLLDSDGWFHVTPDTYPAPKQPSRRERRRQPAGIPADALEDRNRQAYLDKKNKRRRGRKNRHNQQGL